MWYNSRVRSHCVAKSYQLEASHKFDVQEHFGKGQKFGVWEGYWKFKSYLSNNSGQENDGWLCSTNTFIMKKYPCQTSVGGWYF